jgi:hypothetical protein
MATAARRVVVVCALLSIGLGVLAGPERARARAAQHRTTARTAANRTGERLDVLTGRGIGAALFGQSPAQVTTHLRRLLGPPSRRYGRYLGVCEVDHQVGWRDLELYFFHGRFVGYSYGPPPALRAPVLATDRGLAVGDTMAAGRGLYRGEFRLSRAQGGAWFATDRSGTVDGLAAGGPPLGHSDIGPLSRVASIGAGHQGCPAMTP